jgi:hypothetical protein
MMGAAGEHRRRARKTYSNHKEGQTMNLTAWVDVAIGLIVVYLGASLFVTVINEYITQTVNLRGKQLYDSLQELINDSHVKDILMKSPAIKPFFDADAKKAPSYIDPNVFARLLVGGLGLGADAQAGEVVKKVGETLGALPDSGLKTQLQALVQTAGTSADALVKAVSDWADRSLTMLGEGYKRNLQWISFVIGFAVAIGFNIDTIALSESLYRDKDVRDAAVAVGLQIAEKTDKVVFEKCMAMTLQERKKDTSCAQLTGLVDAVQGRNKSLGRLPIGWSSTDIQHQGAGLWLWPTRLAGWLLTALALSLGAPFWFDLLNKLVNIRHGMTKPEVKGDKQGQ